MRTFLVASSVAEDAALEPGSPIEIQNKSKCRCRGWRQRHDSSPNRRRQPVHRSRNERPPIITSTIVSVRILQALIFVSLLFRRSRCAVLSGTSSLLALTFTTTSCEPLKDATNGAER